MIDRELLARVLAAAGLVALPLMPTLTLGITSFFLALAAMTSQIGPLIPQAVWMFASAPLALAFVAAGRRGPDGPLGRSRVSPRPGRGPGGS